MFLPWLWAFMSWESLELCEDGVEGGWAPACGDGRVV
jgi:hypothetical protein